MEKKKSTWDFHRVMRRFGKVSTCSVPAGELSRGAFFCLAAICHGGLKHPGEQGVHVWELAKRTHVHPPAVSRTLRELEAKGLIERSIDPNDRRNVKVSPTSKGLEFFNHAEARAEAMLRRVQEKMGAENITQLVALCDRLCDILEEEHAQYDQSSKET